jgi:putative membrane protein
MSEKAIFRIVMAVSMAVFLLVIVLNRKLIPPPAEIPAFIYKLPLLHGITNGTCSVLLIISYMSIRRKKVTLHKRLNIAAFLLSALFIASYVTYHYMAQETPFPTGNPVRPLYLFILSSHIILAAIVLPLILLSFYHGLKNNVEKHRKPTRWSFPIWLYVTVTGVVVYLMISPYYQFG